MNDLISAAKRKKSNQVASSTNKTKPATPPDSTKGKKTNSQVSKRQAAKKEESPKKTSPTRLAPKNKSKKESPAKAPSRGRDKSTNQKRANSRTRLDSPMAKISIDDEKENKRSSPRKRNRDSSSGSQSSSSQSSQVKNIDQIMTDKNFLYRSKHIFNRKISDKNSAGKASHYVGFDCVSFLGRISNGTSCC